MSIEELLPFFDVLDIAPADWPVRCVVAAPNARAMSEWPHFPAAATPASGRMGSGCAPEQATATRAALGEAIEIASAARWGDEPLRPSAAGDLPGSVWSSAELNGFSAEQVADRVAWNSRLAGLDYVPDPHPPGAPADWVPAHSATGSGKVWLPAADIYLAPREGTSPASADSNGCAASASPEGAQLAAVLELVERDATGRWWYGTRPRPLLSPDGLGAALALFDAISDVGLAPRVFDITSDIGIAVVAATGRAAGGSVALGFAASLTIEVAVHKALCEMAQMALKLEGAVATGQMAMGLADWIAEAGPDVPPLCPAGVDPPRRAPLPNEFGDVLARCHACGVRLALVELTRLEFSVPVWRAVSPDLCHWKPRFGRQRLLAQDRRDSAPPAPRPNPVLLRI